MNNNHLNSNQTPQYVEHEGRYYSYDADTQGLKPLLLPEVAHEDANDFIDNSQITPVEDRLKIERKRVYTFGSRAAIGGLAVAMIVLPPAVHAGTEFVTHLVINGVDQRPDRTITPEDLVGDISKSIGKMMGGL